MSYLGRILLVANPAAQNGAGAVAIERAAENLRAVVGQENVVVARTMGPRHAIELARSVTGCQTVVALGGDGVVHEVANGLMLRPANDRPQLGILPLGSGNDYARALGLTAVTPAEVDQACSRLQAAHPRAVDVGCVRAGWVPETIAQEAETSAGEPDGVGTPSDVASDSTATDGAELEEVETNRAAQTGPAVSGTVPTSNTSSSFTTHYFVETLSFGLDAAIALDTMERRKRTGKSGTALYMASGFDQLFHHLDAHDYSLRLEGETPVEQKGGYAAQKRKHAKKQAFNSEMFASQASAPATDARDSQASAPATDTAVSQASAPTANASHLSSASFSAANALHPITSLEQGQSITFAVQVGPYYGGGFKVCPNASMDDGAFDICISHTPITSLKAAAVFVQAKDGKHLKSCHIEMRRAAGLHVEFAAAPPAQMDGERIEGNVFDISTLPSALVVLA